MTRIKAGTRKKETKEAPGQFHAILIERPWPRMVQMVYFWTFQTEP
jgi:hypothetical protein